VKPKLSKGVGKDQSQAFLHQALAGVIRKCVITKERTLKCSTNDIANVDDPHESVGLLVGDKESAMAIGRNPLEIAAIGGRRSWRRDPTPM